MKVKQVMVEEIKCCGPHDTLNRAAQIMWEHDCGCVPVVSDESGVVGILTDRDICMAAYTQGAILSSIPVSSIMSRELFACRPTDDILIAHRIMREHRVRRLLVTDAEAKLAGLVSLTDIARAMEITHSAAGKAKVADTLVAVFTPHRAGPSSQSGQLQDFHHAPGVGERRRRGTRPSKDSKEVSKTDAAARKDRSGND
jgi:CBS domain-containing protein